MRRILCGMKITGLVLFVSPLSPALLAAPIVVNSIDDPPGYETNLTVGTLGPEVTLRDAITAASNTAGDHVITFDPALAGTTITTRQSTITIPWHSQSRTNDGPTAFRIASNIEIIAPDGGITIRPEGLVRLFDIAHGATVRVERVTVASGASSNGGGFWNAGDLTLDQVTMNSCVASSFFISNTNELGYGGAVFNSGQLVARDSTFMFNNGQNSGGAIFNTANGSMYVTNCIFDANSSEYSGAAIGNESTNGLARVTHSNFTGNQIQFQGNWPTIPIYSGGGAVLNVGVLDMAASRFHSNTLVTAERGGAIHNMGALSLADSTFEANSSSMAHSRGGAIFSAGVLGLTNSTFTANAARLGSAIDNDAGYFMRMVNCTVARNVQNLPETYALDLGIDTDNLLDNNLVVENLQNGDPADVHLSFIGSGNLIGIGGAMLDDLADNGGPVPTMALLSGSPAVDAGIPIAGLVADARGVPRVDAPDVGAFELPTYAPIFTSPASAVFVKGQSNAFQFVVDTGLPTIFVPMTALPGGVNLSLDGLLFGDPTVDSGVYPLTIRATHDYTFTDEPFELIINDGTTDDRYSWQLNNGAELTNGVFTLTDGGIGQTRSAWYLFPQDINAFEASFEYLALSGMDMANGMAFVLQNDPAGPSALGGGGGGLGYTGISPSFALLLNIFDDAPGGRGIQISTGGAGLDTNTYISTAPVNLGSGDPIKVDLLYLGGVLDVTLTNLASSSSFTTSFTVDIPVAVADNDAWVGMTAATDGETAEQYVSNFVFTAISSVSTVVVNNATDPAGFNTNVILSTLGPEITLRDAVNAANNHRGAVVIHFDHALAGTNIALLRTGDTSNGDTALPIHQNITIENNTPGSLTISRGTGDDLRLFRVHEDGHLALHNVRLEGGRAWGLDLYGGNIDNLGSVLIEDSVIADGESWSGGGGLRNAGTGWVARTTFEANTARNAGGGIFNDGTLAVFASTIVSNQTQENAGGPAGGGGIQNLGALSLTNSTIAYNHAGNYYGGAIWNYSGSLDLTACTVAGNSAQSGAPGIWGFHTNVTVRNTILADGSTITLLPDSSNNLFADPGLGAFGFNGGPTPTFPITAASDAHKAGAAMAGLITDQRGVARHAIPDIGAYEIFPRDPLIVSTVIDEDDGNADSEQGTGTSLREALIHAQSLPGPQTITFAPELAGQTIVLDTGWTNASDASALRITNEVVIQGLSTAPGITIAIAPDVEKRHFQILHDGHLTLEDLTLTGGYGELGGSIWNQFGSLIVRRCTFTGNEAGNEGGAIQSWGGTPLLVLENSTIAGNTSGGWGSAITTGANSNSFQHVTITDNAGPNVIFIWQAVIPIHNSIVAGNHSDGIVTFGTGAFDPSSSGNVLGAGNTAGITHGVNDNVTGLTSPNLFLDVLSDANGGPTPTVALLPNSPAVNRGIPLPGFATDQRGTNRVIGIAPDAGAYEMNLAESSVVTTILDEFDATSDPRFGTGTSLREALHYTAATITFSSNLVGQTIALTDVGDTLLGNTALLTTNAFRTINGFGAPRLTIEVDGADPMRHFRVESGRTLWLQNLTLTGGSATNGGAVYVDGTLILNQVTFTGNSADQAGGALFVGSNASIQVFSSTFSGNDAGGWGGAIANQGANYLNYVTIAGNTAGTGGGGIYNEAGSTSSTLEATIVADNTDGLGNPSDIGGPQDLGAGSVYNLIGTGGAGGLVNGVNSNLVGVADAGLAPLAHYGGRTPTRALLPWSPALKVSFLGSGASDQRGVTRGMPRDIGAYELIGSTNPPTMTAFMVTGQDPETADIAFTNQTMASHSLYTTTNLLSPVTWSYVGRALETPPGSGQFFYHLPMGTNAPDRLYMRVQSP